MDALTLWMAVGFLFAGYSVIANDSVQTLGTWIASNNDRFNWKVMWGAASAVLLYTLWYGWYMNGGDISYGRLNKIPFQEIQWYHAMAPALLLILTRIGVPVSTSFLVLSAFASTFVLEKMLVKSMMGYAVAAVAAYVIWIVVSRILDEAKPVKEEKTTLVMNPDFVSLLTHEILGHPSEADRVLGKEMAWAGGAWWKGKIGEKIGSENLNVFDENEIIKIKIKYY